MYRKSCPVCRGDSYSAAARGEWICPYCNADLTGITPRLPGDDRKDEIIAEEKDDKVVSYYKHVKSNVLF